MKIAKEIERKMIYELHHEHQTISATARKYGICRSNLDFLYNWRKIKGDIIFERKYTCYTRDFKLDAVKRVNEGTSIRTVAIDLNIPGESTLQKWVTEFNETGTISCMKKGRKYKKPLQEEIAPIENCGDSEQIKKLKLENLYLRAENEYLKKVKALREAKEKKN